MSTDQDVIIAMAAGDEHSLTELYARYGTMVYNLVLVHLQNTEAAEEVTQDVFLEAFRSVGKFQQRSAIKTWLYRIAVNKSLDRIRRDNAQKRSLWKNVLSISGRPDVARQLPGDFNHPGIQLENKETARELFRAIYQLKGRQKTAFVLAFVENLPRKDVAKIMEVTDKALEGVLQRAKARLRELLQGMNPNRRETD
jgi:RNA polymerase sigma factor (sigma-70 family)